MPATTLSVPTMSTEELTDSSLESPPTSTSKSLSWMPGSKKKGGGMCYDAEWSLVREIHESSTLLNPLR